MNARPNSPDRIAAMQSDLAVLKFQSEGMQKDVADIKAALTSALEADRARIAALEMDNATCKEAWSGHRRQHKNENRNVTAISTVISSVIAGAISWWRS